MTINMTINEKGPEISSGTFSSLLKFETVTMRYFGGHSWDRTNDLPIKSRLLYQLSYMPTVKRPRTWFCSGPLFGVLDGCASNLVGTTFLFVADWTFYVNKFKPRTGKPHENSIPVSATDCRQPDFRVVFMCSRTLFREGAKLEIPGGLMRIMTCGAQRLPGGMRRPIGNIVA